MMKFPPNLALLLVAALALAPLALSGQMSLSVECVSVGTVEAHDEFTDELVCEVMQQATSCCSKPAEVDKESPPSDSTPAPLCDLCLCCPLARAMLVETGVSHALMTAYCGRASFLELGVIKSRTLRPDPHPPKWS
jgi:hypothetical protein